MKYAGSIFRNFVCPMSAVLMFIAAVKHTLYDLRLRLAFVPLIGCWFTPDEDKTKYDDDDV